MPLGKKKLLLFGESGQIGQSISHKFYEKGWDVIAISRSGQPGNPKVIKWNVDLGERDDVPCLVRECGPFDAVCWAQGVNLNDSIYSFDVIAHKKVYEANVLFILATLSALIKSSLLGKPTRLCIVSSIWQNIARQNKLSYAVSKSALQGMVLSLANDMAVEGHLVNAVLPGALDTPMTRNNLSAAQIASIERSTNFGRLPTVDEVASTTYFLCSEENKGVTGQFIKVDLGFSDVRNI
jgi:3-oxoacyl-[acyl-carrier protein] reductase